MECKFDSQNFRLLKSISYKKNTRVFCLGIHMLGVLCEKDDIQTSHFSIRRSGLGHLTEHKMVSYFGLKLKGRLQYWGKLRACSSHKAKLSSCIGHPILGKSQEAGLKYWNDCTYKNWWQILILLLFIMRVNTQKKCVGRGLAKLNFALGCKEVCPNRECSQIEGAPSSTSIIKHKNGL